MSKKIHKAHLLLALSFLANTPIFGADEDKDKPSIVLPPPREIFDIPRVYDPPAPPPPSDTQIKPIWDEGPGIRIETKHG